MIQSKDAASDDISAMGVKCSALRFVFIDEIEATGTEVLAELEESIQRHAPKLFRFDEGAVLPRIWGGVNVLLFGDWWQLPPVGQICIMSSPFQQCALESAMISHVMNMFWDKDNVNSVQRWHCNKSRVLCLNQNRRSGEDKWFSEMLAMCRAGQLSDNQYNFLHGLPTTVCGSWIETFGDASGTAMCGVEACQNFNVVASSILEDTTKPWQQRWNEAKQLECCMCAKERQRRKRVLGCEEYG